MYQKSMKDWKKHLDFILLDILCLYLAFLAACITWNGWKAPFADREYLGLSLILMLLDLVVLIVRNTMKSVLRRSNGKELIQTLKHVLLIEFLIIFFLFFMKVSDAYSRAVIAIFAVYYCVLSYVSRVLLKYRIRKGAKHPKTSMYIITISEEAEDVIRRYTADKTGHYHMAGICLLDRDASGKQILGIPVNSSRENVLEYLCREWVDEVALSIPSTYSLPTDLIENLVEMGIVVHIEMEETAKFGWDVQVVEKIADRTVLTVGMNMVTPFQMFVKRAMDIAGGLVGCMMTLLLTVIIGPMIYIQSPGPIFFSQTRVGKNGKLFKMYKFRSMYLDAEERKAELMEQNRVADGLMFKLEYDPRIIGCEKRPDGTIKKGIGNYIRDWSLDEFPQFFNCLKGDLSLVGTRPPTVDEWEKYELNHRGRLAIKPGITGMWQVSGRSSITDFNQVVELDKKYIREWSIWMDVKILFQTVKAVVHRDGAM